MYLCNRIKETKFFTPLAHWLLVLVLLIMWLVEVSPREWRRLFFYVVISTLDIQN